MPRTPHPTFGNVLDLPVGPGQLIAERFEIDAEVGSGGMGTVYRARDTLIGGPVALKVARDRTDVERFLREVNALAGLHHPRIVRYVAHGTLPAGEPYLAMEWLAGEDLAARLARGPLGTDEALAVAQCAAEALAEMHRHGLVHRDIKPSNLFLVDGKLGGLKLLDFGIARSTQELVPLTLQGQAVGTPAYMAPEQARAEVAVDARADVFSLGCVLFDCLAGRPPFVGDHPIAVLAKLLVDEAPRLHELRPDVPRRLDDLVHRMLAKDPAQRPRDAGELVRELAALREPAPAVALPARRTPALTGEEQRILCVMLSRSVSETDATMLPAQRTVAEQEVRAAITSRGGRLELLANGSMLAIVSGGGAPTELAARAARCALMMAQIAGMEPVVLATGRGVVAGRLPIGAVVDQAVKLLRAGPVQSGAVRIDTVTAGLLDSRFHVRVEGADQLLWGEHDTLETPRTLLGKATSCVGRERELTTLMSTFRECVSEPIARALLLSAPAGAGKSRVLHELLGEIRASGDSVQVLSARCDSLRTGSPFATMTDAVCRSAGVLDGEPLALKRTKLQARLARHLSGDELLAAVEFLGEMAGVAIPANEASEALRAARGDAMAMGDAIRMAWEDWLSAECEASPVLLVIEDLHWGDLPSVRLVDAALARLGQRPFCVVATARPEVHASFPELWANRNLQEIRLGPVTPRASERLVREALGESAGDETVSFLARRSAGHPFFLEELIRAVAEGRGKHSLPDTVLGMVQGRLDALGAEHRRVLRAASVLGESFWRGGVAALIGREPQAVSASLDELIAKEVIVRRRVSRMSKEIEYGFLHALVRDAAYAMLTDTDRALGHRLAGDWLERAGETDAMVLAEHFDRGGDAARALGWYRRGAEQALEGNDIARTIERAERALACGPDVETQATLEYLMSEAHYFGGEIGKAEERAVRAAVRLPESSAVWFQAAAAAIRASGQQGKNDEVEAWTTRAAAMSAAPAAVPAQIVCLCRGASQLLWAQRIAAVEPIFARISELAADLETLPPNAAGWVHRVRAEWAFLQEARLDVMESALGAACACFDRAGALRDACLMRAMQAVYLGILGAAEAAERGALRAIAEAERLGSSYLVSFALTELAIVYLKQERYGDLRQVCLRALEGLKGSARIECGVRIVLALAALSEGNPAEAEQHARTASEAKVADPMRGFAMAALALALTAQSRPAEALEPARTGSSLCEQGGKTDLFSGLPELALAETLHALGDDEAAREAIQAGLARIRVVADRLEDAAVRERFLQQPHPNRRIVELAYELACTA